MVTAAKTGPQDMPPPGGYGPLQWERIKLRTFFTAKLTVGLYVLCTVSGFAVYRYTWRNIKREQIEKRSALFAILPMLIAERDRAFLKQIRLNREVERNLMKANEEWEVGTYFREPVYRTLEGKFLEPRYEEFMGHSDYWDVTYRQLRRHMF